MDKKKKELIIVAVMVPVLAFVVYTNLVSPDKKPKVPSKKVASKQLSQAPPPGGEKEGRTTPPVE